MSTSKTPKRPFTAAMLALAAAAACVLPLAAGQGGPMPRPVVDTAAAGRGRAVYAQHCINCHGSSAKGSERGPDLIRSTVVLRDRAGSGIGPAIRKSATHQAELTDAQVVDLSHFLRQRIDAIVSNRNPRGPINVLTGNPEAGRAYFNGAGTCSSCHSPTGDFAGLATRISDPMTLQQRFLFPSLRRGGPKQVEVTVTPAGGGRATRVCSCAWTTSSSRFVTRAASIRRLHVRPEWPSR